MEDRILETAWYYIWNIPDGIATILAGLFVLWAAYVAWKGVKAQINAQWRDVQEQIHAQERLSAAEKDYNRQLAKEMFYSDLLFYSYSIIMHLSQYNQLCITGGHDIDEDCPWLPDPFIYKSNVEKLGCFREGWVAMAIITVYANVLLLNDISKLPSEDPRRKRITVQDIADIFRKMASNLAHALDGLNSDLKHPIPPELDLDNLKTPSGKTIGKLDPKSLQDILLKLATPD